MKFTKPYEKYFEDMKQETFVGLMNTHDGFSVFISIIVVLSFAFLSMYSIGTLNNIDINDQSTCMEYDHDLPSFFCEPPSQKPMS